MRKGIFAAAVLACGACGGGSSTPASVSGTINGQTMDARDAASNVLVAGSDSVGAIIVTNFANTCAQFTNRQEPRNAKAIIVAIGNQSAASSVSAPAATGTFTIYSGANIGAATGNVGTAAYLATDSNCAATGSFEATTGTVSLTRVDSNGYSGTFDLTFSGTSGHVTGSFNASRCAALGTTVGGTCV